LGMLFATGVAVIVYIGVNRGIDTAHQINEKAEINQLDEAIRQFQTQYNVDYMPSRITLNDPNDQASNQFLRRLFSRYDPRKTYTWNGRDKSRVTLEGHECLVFFLGGIPKGGSVPSCQG